MDPPDQTNSLLYKDFDRNPSILIESASGIYLNARDGRRILDATGGAAVACLGYDNHKVQDAMIHQMSNLSYCHPGFYKTDAAEDLADFLVQSTNDHMSKAILCGSGSEAVEVALKLAKTYFDHLPEPQPKRSNFITRTGAWHGATLGALSLGDFRVRKDPFLPIIPKIASRVAACSPYRGLREGESEQDYVARLAQELDDELLRIGPHTVAAFVAETASGCTTAVPGYFKAIKAVCEKHGILLILDEVMCGMGRTGTVHAWEQEGIVPDIQAVGKGLGSGYCPISAVLVNRCIVDSLAEAGKPFAHGQTYMAHPLAAAAALRVQQCIQEQDLLSNVRSMGLYLEKRLKQALLPHPNVGDIRGRGLFWAVELVANKQTKAPFPSGLGLNRRLHARGMTKGYEIALFGANGTYDGYAGDHFLICPPYTVSAADVDEIISRTVRVVQDTLAKLVK